MPARRVGGVVVGDPEAVKRSVKVTFEPPAAWGPGQVYKDGAVRAKFKAFNPTLSVGGVAQEGQTLTATVQFPLLPPGHPAVSLQVLVTWLREDIGKYWLADGDALARSQLRQRGVYEPNNFIPSIDLRPPEKRRYTVIEGESQIEYVCRMEDIGRRVGVRVQPISATGQLGDVMTAWSSETILRGGVLGCAPGRECGVGAGGGGERERAGWQVLISYPHCTFLTLTDTVTSSELSTRVDRASAAEMQPEAGVRVVFPVVGHEVRADFGYIGGEPGQHAIKWWRVGRRPAELASSLLFGEQEPEPDVLVAVQTTTYTVTQEDNEHQLRVEMVPARVDGAQGCAVGLFTGRISDKCFFSSAKHSHTRGFCPFELSQVDALAKHVPAPSFEPPRTAGIGLVVRAGPRGEQIVRHMLPGMPAATCGKIKPGDILLEVDGEAVEGRQLVDIIPGPEGSLVKLKFERERTEKDGKGFEKQFEVELTRSSPAATISTAEEASQRPAHDALNSTFESVTRETTSLFGEVQSILDPLGYQPPPPSRLSQAGRSPMPSARSPMPSPKP